MIFRPAGTKFFKGNLLNQRAGPAHRQLLGQSRQVPARGLALLLRDGRVGYRVWKGDGDGAGALHTGAISQHKSGKGLSLLHVPPGFCILKKKYINLSS